MRRFVWSGAGAMAGLVSLALQAGAEEIQADTARLGWLDKITARVGEIAVPVGTQTHLGVLAITVKSCVRRLPPDEPESAGFLEVEEQGDTAGPTPVFHGWMFASSPSLSSMDHGVYDVWVLQCVVPADRDTSETPATDDTPALPAPGDGAPPLD
ncbi:DUF2155 domain-containing protein [Pararhodospirillum photometricum]|uniref:Cellulase-like protein n=1 Tax=Pararhodospirillum photometricum DSM 122 TaxID=1150469 RepID=H6SP69_PARPM|nr:DUF2155 domain-containing protein [Pararhodospirillum photometricum]CCG07141.1 Cellulase-like protein [Pararhodospirillum photometricum DSM 122]